MLNFLRKVTLWPAPPPAATSAQFSSSHPMLAGCPVVAGAAVASGKLAPKFPKLHSWLRKNRALADAVAFHVCSERRVDREFLDFRQFALKSQIDQGLDAIARYEALCERSAPGDDAPAQCEPREVRVNAHICDALRRKAEKMVDRDVRMASLNVCRMVTLLSSIDLVPLNYIPVVDFQMLVFPRSHFESNNARCTAINGLIRKYQQNSSVLRHKVYENSEKHKIEKDDIITQISVFHSLLAEYQLHYDQNYRCVGCEKDYASFEDFLNNQNTKGYQLMQKFMESQTNESFKELVKGLVSTYEVQSVEEECLIHSLCSIAVSSTLIPPVQFCGSGVDDIDEIIFGIKLFSVFDSVNLLRIISENFKDEEDPKVIVFKTSEVMKKFSPNFRQIFLQIYEFSIPEYIPDKLRKIRDEIGAFIEQ